MTTQPQNMVEPLLTEREFILSEKDKFGIIEVEKGRSERPLTDAINLFMVGESDRIIPLFASPCLHYNGGFIMSLESPELTKECSRCKQILPFTCFYKNKTRKDGYQHYCKQCKSSIWKPRNQRVTREEYLNGFIKKDRAVQKKEKEIFPEGYKKCSKCGYVLLITLFGKSKQGIDGIDYWCKSCKSKSHHESYFRNKETIAIKSKIYREKSGHDKIYYDKNREKILAQKKEYFEKNREIIREKGRVRYHSDLEKVREVARRYHRENRDWLNPKHLEYHWKNREKLLLRKKQYAREHLEQAKVAHSKYKAKKLGNGGSHTVAEWIFVKEVNGNRCVRCGRPESEIKLTKDHIVPISRGGTDNIGNIQPLCLQCNISKYTKTVDYRGKRLSRGKIRKLD